jgi:hypothetical protein
MRRRQQRDLLYIDRLATKCCGEILTAVTLAASIKEIDNIQKASEYVEKNKSAVGRLIERELYFKWIGEDFIEIKDALKLIDFERIEQFDEANQSTVELLDAHLVTICDKIENETSGVLASVNKIFRAEASQPKLSPNVLQILTEILRSARSIRSTARLMLRPILYRVTDPRIVVTLLIAFVLSIPIWYVWRTETQLTIGSSDGLIDSIAKQARLDVGRLQRNIDASTNVFGRISTVVSFLWNGLLGLPSVFFGLAAVLQVVRISLKPEQAISAQLAPYEELFRQVAERVGVTGGPKFTFMIKQEKIMGDKITNSQVAKGTHIQMSAVDSFKQLEGRYEPDTEAALKEVANIVQSSGNDKAIALYAKFTKELADPHRSTSALRGFWDDLMKVLPSVAKIAGAAGAVAKLIV